MIAMADRTAITIWVIVAVIILGAIAEICRSAATDAEKVKGFEKEIILWKTRYEEAERARAEERRAASHRPSGERDWKER